VSIVKEPISLPTPNAYTNATKTMSHGITNDMKPTTRFSVKNGNAKKTNITQTLQPGAEIIEINSSSE
jgi:hypothetical protein